LILSFPETDSNDAWHMYAPAFAALKGLRLKLLDRPVIFWESTGPLQNILGILSVPFLFTRQLRVMLLPTRSPPNGIVDFVTVISST
jgi:hypothetical protein